MDAAEIYRNILFALSGLSFGAALYSLAVHLKNFRRDARLHLGFAFVSIAWIFSIGMVFLTIIIPITSVPPNGPSYIYGVGLLAGSIGFILVARATRKKWF